MKCPICNHLTLYHDGVGCKISSCDCKKKGKEFRGEGDAPYDVILNSPSFRSISNTTDWFVRFIITAIILTVFSSAMTYYLTFSATYSGSLSDNISNVISTLAGIISVLTSIIGLFWYYRATKNIHSFGAKSVTSPIMAILWWFVPIFNLWKPYYVTQQIWKASNPEVKLTEGTEWIKSPSSKIIKQWWILELLSIAGSGLVGIIDQSNLLAIPFLVIAIISTILFIRIIRQISTWQHLKSLQVFS